MATKKTEGQKFKDCESNYDKFKKAFSIDQLDRLTIDNYAGGKGNRESFSHWLLHGLRGLGSINSRQNFGLFQVYYNSAGEIVYPHNSYNSPEAAMDKIRQTIKDIAECASKGEFEKIDEINFPESVKWKIAFVYAPGELNNKQLIPIYSQEELKKIASKVGMKNIGDNTQISEIHKYLIDNKPANEELSQYYERLWKQSSRKEDKSEDVIKNTGAEPIDSPESKDKDSIMINDLNLIKCLQENSNIILHGAPGTGKTFLAKEIAKAMCGVNDIKELEDSGQFKMVQFHPSYDYTDFVEGLRPKNSDKGDIVFERKDGVFKTFCIDALKNFDDSQIDSKDRRVEENNLQSAYDKLAEDIENGIVTEIPLRSKTKMNIVGISNAGNIVLKTKDSNTQEEYTVSYNRLKKLSQDYKNLDALNGIKSIYKSVTKSINGCHASAYWATLAYLYQKYLPNIESTEINTIERKNFIFLIDEINRGDMSKIFGELFYAIDPGYRGVDGKIATQYQNMLEGSGDVFEDGFYVPDNVYIIGTMNDIDRSVESMDFAMRRRFQFIEVTAESRAEGMGLKTKTTETDAYKRMTNLNNCIISKEIGLSKAYQIGGSYFLKKVIDTDGKKKSEPITENIEFSNLWRYKLEGLLREYLRGEEESEIKKKIAILERAFKRDDIYTYKEEIEEIEMVTPVANQVAPESSN